MWVAPGLGTGVSVGCTGLVIVYRAGIKFDYKCTGVIIRVSISLQKSV